MKFGIISFAHMHAHSYARALAESPGLQLVGIADEVAYRGAQAADRYGAAYYHSHQELLAADIDAVIVCSENARHPEHVRDAAAAGKHILCEKPLAVSLPQARAMIEAADEAGVLLQTAFPVRFSRAVQRMKEIVESGEIGDVIGVNATNRGKMPGGWFLSKELAGGGAVIDHTVHVVDVLRWVLKSEVVRVYAELDTLLHPVDIDDCGLLTMDFDSGVIASLDTSWSRPDDFPTWGDVTMEVAGTKGVISVDAFKQGAMVYGSPGGSSVLKWDWHNDHDREMIEAFAAAAAGEPSDGASGLDGLKAVEVALAAYRSAASGGQAVDLPLDED